MISDRGGDEGRLSTYHLNRVGAEDRGRSPPPLGTPPLHQQSPGEEGEEITASGAFLKGEPEAGDLTERQTDTRGWRLSDSPIHLPCEESLLQGGHTGKVSPILSPVSKVPQHNI